MKISRPITALLFTGLLIPALAYAQIDRLNTTTLAEPAATTLTSPLLMIDPVFILPMDPQEPQPTDPPTTDPNAPTNDPATTDPNTGTTAQITPTDTTTPTTDPFADPAGTPTTPTRPTDPDVPPTDTTTPPETPSLLVPGSTGTFAPTPGFIPRAPLTPSFPPAEPETPPADCPVIEPTPSNPNPVPCPTATPVPVIPQVPYFLLATPFLAIILLWAVLSYMGRRQGALENRYVERNLQHRHAQTVSHARQRTYREMLDFLSNSNSSGQALDGQALQKHLSKLALLGSPEINALGEKTRLAFQNNDRAALKPLMKELAARVKLEL